MTTALLTDLYQLTMMDSYYKLGMEETADFELSVRRLPDRRNFLVAAGLEQVLDYLETLKFSPAELAWLESTQLFERTFLDRLERFRFTGDVDALPEGTVFFGSEPVLRVTAPLPQAQLVESRILNLVHCQTAIASKAARCRLAAGETKLIDFGMRRTQGAEGACLASRASFLAGFDATATVEAGRQFGIPLAGTMAHSFVQAHDIELEAFAHFALCRPENLVLLIDTYDTHAAAHRVAKLANRLREVGITLKGVRIDSGDLAEEARCVRRILDGEDCRYVGILVSGGLDEYAIDAMRKGGAPVDAYCVGTRLAISEDSPSLDCAYKLHAYAGKPRRKRSVGKETWPGARQVFREYDEHGQIAMDMLGCEDEVLEGKALLRPVMVKGHRLAVSPPLTDVREHCRNEIATLNPALRTLECNRDSPVKVSPKQHALANAL